MFSFTVTFESFKPVRGCHMKKVGVHGEGRLVAWTTDETNEPVNLVVAWNGYAENPGSRYSGLRAYYPAETTVYVYDHTDKYGRRHFKHLVGWQTKASK